MAAPTEQRIAVPIDDPNADTEWYGEAKGESQSEVRTNVNVGMISCANMELYPRSPLPLLP